MGRRRAVPVLPYPRVPTRQNRYPYPRAVPHQRCINPPTVIRPIRCHRRQRTLHRCHEWLDDRAVVNPRLGHRHRHHQTARAVHCPVNRAPSAPPRRPAALAIPLPHTPSARCCLSPSAGVPPANAWASAQTPFARVATAWCDQAQAGRPAPVERGNASSPPQRGWSTGTLRAGCASPLSHSRCSVGARLFWALRAGARGWGGRRRSSG